MNSYEVALARAWLDGRLSLSGPEFRARVMQQIDLLPLGGSAAEYAAAVASIVAGAMQADADKLAAERDRERGLRAMTARNDPEGQA